jgi:tetratricopeptide (TPR) repeat protein
VAAAIYAGLHAIRFQAPFASITVIVGGSILADAAVEFEKKHRISPALIKYARPALTLVIFSLVGMRVADLVSNRYYLRAPATFDLFGPGETTMFPEAAAHFLQANGLPANIFNDYNSGGFIAWTLSPAYPDYFDGRSIPFGAAFLMHLEKLLEESPDSPDWQREADNRGINTVILALDRELGGVSALDSFCESKSWRPVFLDAYGAVFLRVTPETRDVLQGRRIECRQVPFDAPPAAISRRSQAERFKYFLHAATILLVLQRNAEAVDKLQQAELIFSDSPFLHYAKGVALQGLGTFPAVEAELLTAIALGSDEAPYVLASLYDRQWRYADEVRILTQAAERASRPHRLYLRLGYAQLAIGRPEDALASFDRAEEESPFVYEAAELGESFRTQITEGRRRAQQLINSQ